MKLNTDAILALPIAEKLDLMELLWADLEERDFAIPVPEWAEREAARRCDEMLADPSLGSGHDETWAKIARRNG